jgi:hypothetical protein
MSYQSIGRLSIDGWLLHNVTDQIHQNSQKIAKQGIKNQSRTTGIKAGTKRFRGGSKSHLLPASMADSHPCRVGNLDAARLQYSEILRRVHAACITLLEANQAKTI